MGPHTVVFAANPIRNSASIAKRLYVVDTVTCANHVVAATRWPDGFLTNVGATDGWIVWTDQSQMQQGTIEPVYSKLWAKNLRTGREVLLTPGSTKTSPIVLQAAVGDGKVAWDVSTGYGRTRAYVHDLATGKRTLVVSGTSASDPQVWGDQVVYGTLYFTKPYAKDPGGHVTLWIRGIAGGTPRALVRGSVQLPMFAAGMVGWQYPGYSDPKGLYVRSVRPGSVPVKIAGRGDTTWGTGLGVDGGNMHLGVGFAVFDDKQTSGWVAVALAPDPPVCHLPRATDYMGVGIDGHTLAWGTRIAEGSFVIHTAQITVPH